MFDFRQVFALLLPSALAVFFGGAAVAGEEIFEEGAAELHPRPRYEPQGTLLLAFSDERSRNAGPRRRQDAHILSRNLRPLHQQQHLLAIEDLSA